MIKKGGIKLFCLLNIFIFLPQVKAQSVASVVDVKLKKCKVVFSLENTGSTNLEVSNLMVSYIRGKYRPNSYSLSKDTLEIKLKEEGELIQSGHSLRDSVVVQGRRVKRLVIKPREKMPFLVPLNKDRADLNVIKLVLSSGLVSYVVKKN